MKFRFRFFEHTYSNYGTFLIEDIVIGSREMSEHIFRSFHHLKIKIDLLLL